MPGAGRAGHWRRVRAAGQRGEGHPGGRRAPGCALHPRVARGRTDSVRGRLLDDATYKADAGATAGTVSYSAPVLTWSGSLDPGHAATVTFSVTVNNPDTGDKALTSTVSSAAAGSNCPSSPANPSCAATVNVAVLTLVNSTSASTAVPGQVVRFTGTFTNDGKVPYTGITVSVNAAHVLDDATYNGDETATSGSLSLAGNGLTWTGDIPVGGTVTATGSATVKNPDTAGDKVMTGTLVTAAPGSNCPASSTDPRCTATTDVLIPALDITETADATSASPGQVVRYTITVANTGETAYTGATVTDDLTSVLDEATYHGDADSSSGTVTYASPDLTWTGDLAIGASATITYTVTVNDPQTGDLTLLNRVSSDALGSTCPPGATTSGCAVSIPVIRGLLSIGAPSTASLGQGSPGAAISGSLGTVQVTDDRAIAGAAWTATVASTDFTNTGVSPTQTISADNAGYLISSAPVTTGTATFTTVPFSPISGVPQGVVTASNANGSNSAAWSPLIQVSIPTAAIAGTYTATITHSVS